MAGEVWCVELRLVVARLREVCYGGVSFGRQVPARQVVLCYGGLLRVTVRQARFGSVG